MKKLSLAVILTLLLSGCSASLSDYDNTSPTIDLATYFDGKSVARGVLQDYKGVFTRHFCVDINAKWKGNKGQLHEQFYFNDGERQTRIWQLTVNEDGSVTGSAGDVVGIASGNTNGAAFRWQYTLAIPINGDSYEFSVDDWIIQTDKDRLINRSYLKKWGITVAEIFIHFDKSVHHQSCVEGLESQ